VIYRTANVNRQRVLVVAPAALKTSMWEPFLQTHDFSRWVRVYSVRWLSPNGAGRGWHGARRKVIIFSSFSDTIIPKALSPSEALNASLTDEEHLSRVTQVLDEAGITAPPPREPLPAVEEHEVHLVAWMAVRGIRVG
jgi:hypothetical protein